MSKNSTLNAGDLAHAMLPAFTRKVSMACDLIERSMVHGNVGISFSTGKDSTVVLDLVRRIIPDAPVAYFYSGDETEYDENLQLIAEHYQFVDVIHSEQTMADLMRNYGALGHKAEIIEAKVKWGAFLVGEPSMRFTTKYDLKITVMGLRRAESTGRRMSAARRGEFYRLDDSYYCGNEHYHLLPILFWSDADVWAYIASRNLPYNTVYDKMTEAGIPRNEQRVSVLVGEAASNLGRYSYLRMIAPDKFQHLCSEFPRLGGKT